MTRFSDALDAAQYAHDDRDVLPVFVGIDPGKAGAIVGLRGTAASVVQARAYYAGSDLVPSLFIAALRSVHSELGGGPVRVGVEYQQAMPKQGLSSTYRTGLNYGRILGGLEGIGWSVVEMRPAKWRKLAGVVVARGADPKAATIAEVSRRLPQVDLVPGRCRVPQDGIADAAGIALAVGQV